MARSTFGNTSSSSLMSAAKAGYNHVQAYNDSMASNIYDLSPKTQEDYNNYQNYLKGAISKTADPNRELSLQKTVTSAYRAYNSAEISRQSMQVNYGNQDDTQKYNNMFGLYQQAIANGDGSLAQSIEGQLGTLSVKIQNAAEASARAGAAASAKARAASSASFNNQLNDLGNKIDLAYQTGQPLTVNGQDKYLSATDYALARAAVVQAKHQFLTSETQNDPTSKYADQLSALEKSDEYRSLIGSGAVQFDANGQPQTTAKLNNLAVTFGKDSVGNTIRKYEAVQPDANGKPQYGLIQHDPLDGSGPQKQFVSNQQLNTTNTDPSLKSRVAAPLTTLQDAQGNPVKGIDTYVNQVNGKQVLVDPTTGLRSVVQTGPKDKGRTVPNAQSDLKNLVDNPQSSDNILSDIGRSFTSSSDSPLGSFFAKTFGSFNPGKEFGNLFRPQLASSSYQQNNGSHLADFGRMQATQKQVAIDASNRAAAQAAAQAAQTKAYNDQQLASLNAATAARNAANAQKIPSFRTPPPTLSPSLAFLNSTQGNTSAPAVAKGIADTVGYTGQLNSLGW